MHFYRFINLNAMPVLLVVFKNAVVALGNCTLYIAPICFFGGRGLVSACAITGLNLSQCSLK